MTLVRLDTDGEALRKRGRYPNEEEPFVTRHPKSRSTSWILSGLVGLSLVAALPAPALAHRTVEREASSATHVVKRGESLWTIARLRYGRASQWPRLYRLNRNLIGANPSVIRPGMQLQLAEPQAAQPVSAPPVAVTRPTPSPAPTLQPVVEIETIPAEPMPVLELSEPELASSRHLAYLPVATSLVVPGSGQMLQGDWEKGLAHLGVMTVSFLALKTGAEQGDRPMQVLGGLGLVGITLWSPWQAFQTVQSETSGGTSILAIE